MPTLWGYKEDYVTRNGPEMFRDSWETGPSPEKSPSIVMGASFNRSQPILLYCFFLKVLFSVIVTGKRLRGLGPVSRKSRELFGPEKPILKLRPAYSVKLVFWNVVKGIKVKITAKYRASRRLRFEDTKKIMSPEIRPKSFGTFEKQAPGAFGTFGKRALGVKGAIFVGLIDWVFVLFFFFWSFYFFWLFCCCFSFSWTCWVVSNRLRDKRIFFPPNRMLVVMWRWRGNLIRSLTFLSSVMRSIKGEWVLLMFICLCNEFWFMFCLMNFSLDIPNFHPFPCFLLFLLRLRLNKTLRIFLLGLISPRVLFFPVESTVKKKTLEFACLLMCFCFLCCTENKEKWPGNSRGLSEHPSGEPQLPDKTRNTKRRNNAVIAFELVSCKMTQQGGW